MDRGNLKDGIDYLTSNRMLVSDKYGIWRFDSIGVFAGIIFLIWGFLDYSFPNWWRFLLIIIGAILLSVCSLRIERRYSQFKKDIMKDLERVQHH